MSEQAQVVAVQPSGSSGEALLDQLETTLQRLKRLDDTGTGCRRYVLESAQDYEAARHFLEGQLYLLDHNWQEHVMVVIEQ